MRQRTRLSGALAASLVCLLWASSASAGIQSNGVHLNGVNMNGVNMNGVNMNGITLNGVNMNGVNMNGVNLNGVNMNGVNMNGFKVNGAALDIQMVPPTYGLPHHEQAEGVAMPWGGSACVATVCNADSYCCNTYWDSQCVREANSWCTRKQYTGSNIIGDIMTANLTSALSNGKTTLSVKLDAVNSNGTAYWVSQNGVWINLNVSHQLSYASFCAHSPTVQGAPLKADCSSCAAEVTARDPYCKNNWWDAICVQEAQAWCGATASSSWSPICGYDDTNGDGNPDGVPTQAILLSGLWNYNQGYLGAGGKYPSNTNYVTISCKKKGAIAKCVDMGYQPWRSSMYDMRHQACVRMVRNDMCGTGTPSTLNGTPINVYDDLNIQTDAAAWAWEGSWSPNGAECHFYHYSGSSSTIMRDPWYTPVAGSQCNVKKWVDYSAGTKQSFDCSPYSSSYSIQNEVQM